MYYKNTEINGMRHSLVCLIGRAGTSPPRIAGHFLRRHQILRTCGYVHSNTVYVTNEFAPGCHNVFNFFHCQYNVDINYAHK